MKLSRIAAAAGAVVSAACLFGALAAPATAAATPFSDRQVQNVAGDVFACKPTNLTVTAGTITIAVHGVQDGAKLYHMAGTVVPSGVRLTDGTHHFVLSGAEAFSGLSTDAAGNVVIRSQDSQHFVIRKTSGAVYARVALVEHFSAKHHSFTLNRGACMTPNS